MSSGSESIPVKWHVYIVHKCSEEILFVSDSRPLPSCPIMLVFNTHWHTCCWSHWLRRQSALRAQNDICIYLYMLLLSYYILLLSTSRRLGWNSGNYFCSAQHTTPIKKKCRCGCVNPCKVFYDLSQSPCFNCAKAWASSICCGFIVLVSKLSVSGMFHVEAKVWTLIAIIHKPKQSLSSESIWARPVSTTFQVGDMLSRSP